MGNVDDRAFGTYRFAIDCDWHGFSPLIASALRAGRIILGMGGVQFA
jgi:hypothetical protein